uniref:Rx N-terminal domain-containing protein n=1 Tax=Aegilops tauschii TaxID=37682 RepID=M8AJB3_AEGTA
MEAVLSAVTGDLVSRFYSFLISKYSALTCSGETHVDVERLQQLLLRAQMVVEEADARYITNSGMLLQLKMLARAMYHGYYALDTFKCNQLINKEGSKEVMDTGSFGSYLGTPLKRFRTNTDVSSHKVYNKCDLEDALLNLETAVSNITEFVILLGGCQPMFRRPYDTYLYINNFMFGRWTEKQQVINFLLQCFHLGSPPVLAIIGGFQVGKKTLVAHVCNDENVRSYFSSILHFNEDNFCRIDNERCTSGRTLVIVEFHSDVDDEKWKPFYRAMTSMSIGSKVIIISRMESLKRYGTVKPIHLSRLPDEEYIYLFKTLAFGSSRSEDHPKLMLLAGEFIKLLDGSFVAAYSVTNGLRTNLSPQYWICMFNRYKNVMKNNLSMFGEHISNRFERHYPVDFTSFLPSPAAPLYVMPPLTEAEVSERRLPKIRIRDIIDDPSILPKGDFVLVIWESRIPPYTKFSYHVPSCAQPQPKTTLRRKREATISLQCLSIFSFVWCSSKFL